MKSIALLVHMILASTCLAQGPAKAKAEKELEPYLAKIQRGTPPEIVKVVDKGFTMGRFISKKPPVAEVAPMGDKFIARIQWTSLFQQKSIFPTADQAEMAPWPPVGAGVDLNGNKIQAKAKAYWAVMYYDMGKWELSHISPAVKDQDPVNARSRLTIPKNADSPWIKSLK